MRSAFERRGAALPVCCPTSLANAGIAGHQGTPPPGSAEAGGDRCKELGIARSDIESVAQVGQSEEIRALR